MHDHTDLVKRLRTAVLDRRIIGTCCFTYNLDESAAAIESLLADRAVLAAEVRKIREVQKDCTRAECGKRGDAYLARLNTDASGVLDRCQPQPEGA